MVINSGDKNYIEQTRTLLKNKGYKLTGPRLAILDYMARQKGHPDIQEIFNSVSIKQPGIGIVTVYRTVELFLGIGLLRALTLDDGKLRYEMNRPDHHHHHLVCNGCGVVVEFETCNFQQVAEEIEKVTRFRIDEHTLEAYGLCPACLQ